MFEIKRLEWNEVVIDTGTNRRVHHVCSPGLRRLYCIVVTASGSCSVTNVTPYRFQNIEQAKNACQLHYEQEVKIHLQPVNGC